MFKYPKTLLFSFIAFSALLYSQFRIGVTLLAVGIFGILIYVALKIYKSEGGQSKNAASLLLFSKVLIIIFVIGLGLILLLASFIESVGNGCGTSC